MQERVLRGRKALELDRTGDKIALHAEHLEKNLKSYMSSVRGVLDHISVSTIGLKMIYYIDPWVDIMDF